MKKLISLILLAAFLGTTAFAYQGVDIYYGSSTVDFKQLKASGHGDFVWIKSSEGEHTKDPALLKHVSGAESVGMPWGAYHFMRMYSVQSAVKQADFFYSQIKGKNYKIIPAVDVESYDGQKYASNIRAMVRAFINEFYRLAGYKPVLYTYTDYAINVLGSNFTDCKLWLADYRGYHGTVPGWGNKYSAWQYSGDVARVNGVDNPCDLDISDASIFMPVKQTTSVKPKITYRYIAKVKPADAKFRTVRSSASWYSNKLGVVRPGDKYEIYSKVTKDGWIQIG